jgi:hypothetical protein
LTGAAAAIIIAPFVTARLRREVIDHDPAHEPCDAGTAGLWPVGRAGSGLLSAADGRAGRGSDR